MTQSSDKKRAIAAFKKYLKETSLINTSNNNIRNRRWREVISNKRPFQKDVFNCGVYVIYYLECIIREKSFDENFNPVQYRMTIAETLLTSSRCMKEICQYCFSDRNIPLVMCNTCRR